MNGERARGRRRARGDKVKMEREEDDDNEIDGEYVLLISYATKLGNNCMPEMWASSYT